MEITQNNGKQSSLTKVGFDKYKYIALPLSILLLIFSVILMDVITSVREKELRISLQRIDENPNSGGKSVGLISRYQIIRKRFGSKNETADDYLAEGEMMAVMSGDFSRSKVEIKRFSFLEKPAIVVMNFIGYIARAEPIQDLSEDRGYKLQQMAYFYERKREFKKSIQVYNAAIQHYEGDNKNLAYVYLHRGFSKSFIGKRKEAIADYKKVIALDNDSEMGLTAEVLISFLQDIQTRLKRVNSMKKSVKKGESYYRLMAYHKAINTLNQMEKKRGSQKLYFYRGRSYEEVGNTKMAISDYRKAISMNKKNSLAKNANRRLYLIGSVYGNNKKLKTESQKNAVVLKDTKFLKKSALFLKAVDSEKVAVLEENSETKSTRKYVEKTTAKPLKAAVVAVSKPKLAKIIASKPKAKAKTRPTKVRVTKIKPKKKKEPKKTGLSKKRITDPSLTNQQRKILLIKRYRKVNKVWTKDGNIFVGAIIKNTSSKLTIVTVFGIVNVPKAKIAMNLKIESKAGVK